MIHRDDPAPVTEVIRDFASWAAAGYQPGRRAEETPGCPTPLPDAPAR